MSGNIEQVCVLPKPMGEIAEALDYLDAAIERAQDKFGYLRDEIENVCRPAEVPMGELDEASHNSTLGRRIQTARQRVETLCADIDTLRARLAL